MKDIKKQRSGFTIVELLIVIVVIGVLASISIVAYNGVTAKAWNAKVTSLARQYIGIIEMYKMEKGHYPWAEAEYVCLPGTFPAKDGFAANSCEINGLAGSAAIPTTLGSGLNPGQELKNYFPGLPDSSYGTVISGTLGSPGFTQAKARGLIYTDDGGPSLLYHLMKTSSCPIGSSRTVPGSNGILCHYIFSDQS
jgi:prepilin-type N-terminal cleavage/methylation domain-containing protein